jgi:IclR family pca regulon transcriptional regulator
LTIAEVAKATGLNRATARRFLHTLEADGYVGSENGRYALRPRVLEFGYAYLSSISANDIIQQQLLELAERLRESCSAGVLDGHDVVFVARARTSFPRVMTLALSVGTRIPAYLTAIGRVLLADLPDNELDEYLRTAQLHKETEKTITDRAKLRNEIFDVRSTGYSITDQEIEIGIRAAVPVRQPNRPTIAISVATHASRESVRSIEKNYLPPLREAADELQRVLPLRN